MANRLGPFATALSLCTLLGGCFPEADGEVEAYRAALPLQEAGTLDGPEASSSTAASSDPSRLAPTGAPWSKYYVFTRDVRNGVNRITASILGTVWYVANTKPTKVTKDEATWGPYSDPLEPATWRFRATRTAKHEYAYTLEGRPRDSNAEADYQTVLGGVGYDDNDERHGDGTFTIDVDAAKSLDPFSNTDDSGTITVTHDLPENVTRELAPLPRTIEVELAPSASAAHLVVTSVARLDNTGTLLVSGDADIDESKKTLLEEVTIASQWNSAGEGRADVTIAGGDVPALMSPVSAVECWDRYFKQSYYADSAGIATTVGSPSACAYEDAAQTE